MDLAVLGDEAVGAREIRALSQLWAEAFPDSKADLETRVQAWLERRSPLDATRRHYVIWGEDAAGNLLALSACRTFVVPLKTTVGTLSVLALAGVATAQSHRGKGLGRAVVAQAFTAVDAGAVPLSLFQTGVPGFYRKLGCAAVDNRFVDSTAEDPEANPWWNPHVMVYAPRGGWPEGLVDLAQKGW